MDFRFTPEQEQFRESVRRFAEGGAETADEVRLGDMSHRGHGTDVERLGVRAVHGVAGAQ